MTRPGPTSTTTSSSILFSFCHPFFNYRAPAWSYVSIWLLLSLLIQPSSALHFYASAKEPTCFYRDLNQGQLLLGKYKMEILDPYSFMYYVPRDVVGVLIDVELEGSRIVHQRGVPAGRFTFNALDSGQHRVCFEPKSFATGKDKDLRDAKFKKARIRIELEVVEAEDLADISGTASQQSVDESTTGLVRKINRLTSKLVAIRREQNLVREKEVQFRDLSERTLDRTAFWMKVQGSIFIIACIYQAFAMRRVKIKED